MTAHRHELMAVARRAMVQYGLQPDFPAAATAEADAMQDGPIAPGPGVRDMRDRLWASIDNNDSRDLDQLSVAEPGKDDATTILIAIADVDARVPEDSALDGHARTNTTSVYTAAGIFPMLPERLSTDLTSLGQDEERLAVVVEMTVDRDGAVTRSDAYRALVLNRAKLTYDGVAAWLDGTAPAPPRLSAVRGLDEQIRIQDRVAQALNARRHHRGALDLDTRQARPVFAGEVLDDLRPDDPNRAKAMIEDFMIAANSVTARYLEDHGFPSLRRVLRVPKRWERIVDIAAQLGERLPSSPDVEALQQFLNRRRTADPERFEDLSLSVVKLLGSGEYAVEHPRERAGEQAGQQVEGHFGLAVKDYTHSTAPNRRYPDLATQRLLKAAIAGRRPPATLEELTAIARHCTAQEDNAAKVERQVQKSAAALLLASRHGDRFDGIVTGASEKGTWVRITRPSVEGKVVQGASGLDVGDRVRVRLIHTDVGRGFIDFARA